MLEQEISIAKVRELAVEDERLVAVLMYGSFALSEGDRLSDIEFYLYFGAPLDRIDRRRWLEGIAPLEMHYVNEFGTDTAIFANAIRGEFHFEPASSIPSVARWDKRLVPAAGRGNRPRPNRRADSHPRALCTGAACKGLPSDRGLRLSSIWVVVSNRRTGIVPHPPESSRVGRRFGVAGPGHSTGRELGSLTPAFPGARLGSAWVSAESRPGVLRRPSHQESGQQQNGVEP